MGSKRQKKQPRREFNPPGHTKVPAAPAAVDWNQRRPVWRFNRADLAGRWCWNEGNDALRKIVKKLGDFETMTWGELQRPGQHPTSTRIAIDRLDPLAQARLTEIDADDTDFLWELHLGGEPRLWGIRVLGDFFLLWWDPGHEVCPVTKRG